MTKMTVQQAKEYCDECGVCRGTPSEFCSNGACLVSHTFLDLYDRVRQIIVALAITANERPCEPSHHCDFRVRTEAIKSRAKEALALWDSIEGE